MSSKILYQNFIFCALILFSVLVSAQESPVNLSNSVFKDAQVIFDKNGEGTKYIKFTQGNGISLESFFREYSRAFNWSDDNEAKPFRVTKDNIGQTHHRYKQYYKGIELADVEFILHEKNGNIITANGNLIHGLNLNIVPTISEQVALQYALADINAESYMWENEKNESHLRKEQDDPNATMRPKGALILSAKNFEFEKENFHLVYRFDIYAEKPLDRYYIDVDAHSGEIINKISRMQSGDVPGQGTSFYNGVVQMTVADTAITIVPPSRWHPDSWNGYENGLSWWCADPSYGNQGGYANCWYEVLDTDPIMLSGSNLNLQFVHRYSTETPYVYQGYDGFDGMNVRISTDNGTTWIILQNPNPAYTNSSLFSFGYEFNEGVGIPGWAGLLSNWTNVNIDLNAYAGQNVKIRFAFASDNSVSTFDGTPDSFSWQVDNIVISNSLDTLFSNSGVSGGVTVTNLAREVSLIEGNYRLRQYSRGGGISTYDARHTASTTLSTDFVDNDTNFDSENGRVGVSVHWGLENTYDYYLNTFNRNSFDDNGSKYIAYAHYGNAWDNAMWDGTRMLYGDGPGNSIPLVSIDVVGHELTHGVTQYTANLIYLNEFGALNESFSDIFGTAVEFYALGSGANWLMFDFRSMSDPKQFQQPDTYHGQYWAYGDPTDYGGVHTNSGVQNFWYYLLSEGGSGVNDYGHSYSVAGIGMDAASKISYRNLANYLVPTSEYFDTRFCSMNAAQDLFGLNSPEFQSVIDAWNAVGVMKPNLVPTVGIERDTVNFLAEVQFRPDTVDIYISNYGLETLKY